MKVEIFPGGGVHSAYLDVINEPPAGVEYVGDFSHSNRSAYSSGWSGVAKRFLDKLRLPYILKPENGNGVDFIHSSQKLLFTDKNYAIDIEHGNPFMGADVVDKYKWPHYRWVVSKILNKDNCKYVMPWTDTAW